MNIGLDYDDTYTRDPAMWNFIIGTVRCAGHKIYIVTWRDEEEAKKMKIEVAVDGVYPTNRKAKQKFMFDQAICIDVWIDDNPSAILNDMQPYSGAAWK